MRGRKFEGVSVSLHRYISELLLSCCAVGGKIISFFLLSHWRFELLPLSLLGSGLDLSSEKIKFILSLSLCLCSVFTSIGGCHSACDKLSFHMLLHLLFSNNKLYLHVVLPI